MSAPETAVDFEGATKGPMQKGARFGTVWTTDTQELTADFNPAGARGTLGRDVIEADMDLYIAAINPLSGYLALRDENERLRKRKAELEDALVIVCESVGFDRLKDACGADYPAIDEAFTDALFGKMLRNREQEVAPE